MAGQGPIFFFNENKENGYLSQWYPSPFRATVDGREHLYHTAEQYMMHRKTLPPASQPDHSTAREILLSQSPCTCKSLGKQIRGFSNERWDRVKFDVVVQGSVLKFESSEELRALLLETGERELVEASHFDSTWGVGYSVEQCRKGKRVGAGGESWGLNLLGKALMEARRRIRERMEGDAEEATGQDGD